MTRPLSAVDRGRMTDRVAQLALALAAPDGVQSLRDYMRAELDGHLRTLRAPADLRAAVRRTAGAPSGCAPTMAKLLRWLRTGGR